MISILSLIADYRVQFFHIENYLGVHAVKLFSVNIQQYSSHFVQVKSISSINLHFP